jgi:hypothetical protein
VADSIDDTVFSSPEPLYYDGEIPKYLFRARKWIDRADRSGDQAFPKGHGFDEARSMADIGAAHVLLAAVIMLLNDHRIEAEKESP